MAMEDPMRLRFDTGLRKMMMVVAMIPTRLMVLPAGRPRRYQWALARRTLGAARRWPLTDSVRDSIALAGATGTRQAGKGTG